MGPAIILLVAVVLVVLFVINMQRDLVGKKNQVDNAFGSVDVLLKKRCDLIPNLVATVKEYMKYEQETLTEVTRLRSRMMSGNLPPDQRIAAENQLSHGLSNIMVAIENYPELKANGNVTSLQESLNEVEEQISAARRFYNSAVVSYNDSVEMFPTSMMASIMNYARKQVFEATAQERQTPDVKGLFQS
jgi:LemA protein